MKLHTFTRRHHKPFAVTELGLLVAATATLVAVVMLLTFAGLVRAVGG